jgi:hypothetical protein
MLGKPMLGKLLLGRLRHRKVGSGEGEPQPLRFINSEGAEVHVKLEEREWGCVVGHTRPIVTHRLR